VNSRGENRKRKEEGKEKKERKRGKKVLITEETNY
jgi:hypothetical protein